MMSFKCFRLEDVPFIVGRFMDVRSLNGNIIVERFLCFTRYLFIEMPSLYYFLRSRFLLASLLLVNLTLVTNDFIRKTKNFWKMRSRFDLYLMEQHSKIGSHE